MGRPSKPMALHIVHGTKRARHKGRENELKLASGSVGTCPAWLPPEGKEEWARLTGDKDYRRCLAPAHRGALIDYCNLFGRMERSERRLPQWINGKEVEGSTEVLTSSERNSMHSLRMQLGLTPASQSKVQMPAAQTNDGWEEFDQA